MRPIAQDIDWIRPPMYGRRSSRGGAFSSVPGMLICPCLSAPPRLLPAPPALALEAAWYIANLTAHSCATRGAFDGSYFSRLATLLASLDRNRTFGLWLASVGPPHSSLSLPFSLFCLSIPTHGVSADPPRPRRHLPRPQPPTTHDSQQPCPWPSLCALRMHAQQALPNVLLSTQPADEVI